MSLTPPAVMWNRILQWSQMDPFESHNVGLSHLTQRCTFSYSRGQHHTKQCNTSRYPRQVSTCLHCASRGLICPPNPPPGRPSTSACAAGRACMPDQGPMRLCAYAACASETRVAWAAACVIATSCSLTAPRVSAASGKASLTFTCSAGARFGRHCVEMPSRSTDSIRAASTYSRTNHRRHWTYACNKSDGRQPASLSPQ